MSDTLAHKLLAALEHAGVGGAAVKELADEHLPAVDPETGVRPPVKASSSSSGGKSTGRSSRSRSRASSAKPKAGTTAGSSSGGGSQQTSDAG